MVKRLLRKAVPKKPRVPRQTKPKPEQKPTNHNQNRNSNKVIVNIGKNHSQSNNHIQQPLFVHNHSYGPTDTIQTQLLMDLSHNIRQLQVQAPQHIQLPAITHLPSPAYVPIESKHDKLMDEYSAIKLPHNEFLNSTKKDYHSIRDPAPLNLMNDFMSAGPAVSDEPIQPLAPQMTNAPQHISASSSSLMTLPTATGIVPHYKDGRPKKSYEVSTENIPHLTVSQLKTLAHLKNVSIPPSMKRKDAIVGHLKRELGE